MALTQDRDTPRREGLAANYPVAAGVEIFAGSLVVLENGLARPGRSAVALVALGRAREHVDNTGGADGDLRVEVQMGVFAYANDVAAPVNLEHVGQNCFVFDDERVSADTSGRSEAGKVFDVDERGVWVRFG